MKGIRRIILLIAIVCLLGGCGNKSTPELVNIEQFKCQDSIETVFAVLGEVDMQTSVFGADYYEFENLNLWGYSGKAVFTVRDDYDTIQDFYCHLLLNDKEFEDMLSYFSDKYGSYEADKLGDIKTYKWEIDKKQAETTGYNDIHIQYNGKNKYTVYFEDDMSSVEDEVYYETLKETEDRTESRESFETGETKVIKKKEYDLGNKDKMTIGITEQDGKESLYLSADILNEEKAALAFGYFYSIISQEEMKEYGTSISVISGEKAVMYSDGIVVGTGVDGKPVSALPDWVDDAMNAMDDESEEISAFLNTLHDYVQDFLN